jgi:hypothetical protein
MVLACHTIGEPVCSQELLSDKLYTTDTIVASSIAHSIPEVV